MKNFRLFIIYFCFIGIFWSCSSEETSLRDGCLPQVEAEKLPKITIDIERLEQTLFGLQSKEEIKAFLDEQKFLSERFFERERYPNDSLLINMLYDFITAAPNQELYQDVQKKFSNLEALRSDLQAAFQQIKYYYPDFKIPRIYTMLSGFGGAPISKEPDLFIREGIIVIGLEFFMGSDYRYQPPYPAYIARRYKPEAIVPFIVQTASLRFNEYNTQDQSALAEMIFYGKSLYFMQKVVTCLPDSAVLGYTPEQIEAIEENKEYIWTHYIDKNILYQTSHLIKKDYLDESPFCIPLGQEWCPGAIGRWTGLRIVKKYMQKHPEKTIQELMRMQDSQEILQASKYRGE